MAAKTITMSVRLSENDSDFLTSLKINNAKTPSDKIRAIIEQARILKQSSSDFNESVNLLRNLSESTVQRLLDSERKSNLHSDLISMFTPWITESLAYFITSIEPEKGELSKEELEEIESGVASRVFYLIENILRMGVTEKAPCYNPELLSGKIEPILELTEIIKLYRKSKEEKAK